MRANGGAHVSKLLSKGKIIMATVNIYRTKLKAASRFMAVQDIRFYLNGVLIESNDIQTRIVATDGHTLFAGYDDAKGDNVGSFAGIMPADTVKQILGWKANYKTANDMPVVLTTSDDPTGEHRAEWCGNICIFRLIEGKFPDYARVVPTDVNGAPAFYQPEYLLRCSKAAIDLNTNKLGHFDFKQGGDGSGIAVFSPQSFAVIMPIRNTVADVADVAWARAPLPAPTADEQAAA
jgi:DNA polymerase-3 subunit beta